MSRRSKIRVFRGTDHRWRITGPGWDATCDTWATAFDEAIESFHLTREGPCC